MKGNTYIEMDDYTLIVVISKKYGKFLIRIDKEDVEKVKDYTWGVSKVKDKFYVQTQVPVDGKQKNTLLHRLIMNFPDPKLDIDHINGVTTDCRKSNLRICTHKENIRSRLRANKLSTSNFIGVCLDRDKSHNPKWKAQIVVDGKTINLGRYDKEIEAAKVRDKASKKYFGEFAKLNFE